MISILKYSLEHKESWDQFVDESVNATFLFKRDFMEYHSDRFQDHSLLVFKKQKIAAVIPLNQVDNNVYSHQGLTYGGLVVLKNESLLTTIKYFKSILEYLNKNNIESLIYKQIPSFYNLQPSDEVDYIMFLLQAKLYRRDVAITVNYSSDYKISGNYKREAKKALNIGAKVVDQDFSSFWNNVLIPNLNEKYNIQPVHSLEEITLLNKKFPNNIIQYNVIIGDEIVAGTTLFITKKCVHCQYIASTEAGRKSGALNLLFIELIKKYSQNYSFFDFGIVNENNGLDINFGMLFWKEHLGGSAIKHDFYKIESSNYCLLYTSPSPRDS